MGDRRRGPALAAAPDRTQTGLLLLAIVIVVHGLAGRSSRRGTCRPC